jgi:hypothetical protein
MPVSSYGDPHASFSISSFVFRRTKSPMEPPPPQQVSKTCNSVFWSVDHTVWLHTVNYLFWCHICWSVFVILYYCLTLPSFFFYEHYFATVRAYSSSMLLVCECVFVLVFLSFVNEIIYFHLVPLGCGKERFDPVSSCLISWCSSCSYSRCLLLNNPISPRKHCKRNCRTWRDESCCATLS